MIPAPVVALIFLAAVGLAVVYASRPGSAPETVGGILALSALIAIPVGLAMGAWTATS